MSHQLAMNLRGAQAHLRRRSNLALSSFGMTADQFVLLTVLADQGEATQQDLVRKCYSDTATIGTMLLLLESNGLVKRAPHPADGRARTVTLTSAGQRLQKAMSQATDNVRSEMAALFNEQELTTLIEFLGRLASALSPQPRTTTTSRSRLVILSNRLSKKPREKKAPFKDRSN